MPTEMASGLAGKAVAQSDDKQFIVTLLLACIGLCLGNVAAAFAIPTVARAFELMGQY